VLFLLFILLLLAAAGVAGIWGYRTYVAGGAVAPWSSWFAPRPMPRLTISEQATLDNRRRLVLIRRDDVEHLIMTGGPVDVVIETGINAPAVAATGTPSAEPSPPVFSRQPRNFGQAVNE
jgi:flagellar protein FliO/FliZ